ncbi:uncharacterized protein LOC128199512 [Bicyclus anynana]|uniref:Uncharacterized protein LOC128199512 n=1 Tax=Bicyclus anynana TaxID=110368 RepID=A0ABM3M382_BICAN|nr:uncharacterized protein LOC128199512 [Bicyclus anynana]
MEEWEAVIKSCQNATASDTKLFAQVLKSTEIVLAEDLAPFETERVVSTLLNDPVQLLCVVAARRTDNDWAATVRDSLKLLASTVTKHRLSEKYYDDIVELCLLHYSPLAQQAALGCLAAVARRSAAGARGLRRHVASLEETATCKAPLATLIGNEYVYRVSVAAAPAALLPAGAASSVGLPGGGGAALGGGRARPAAARRLTRGDRHVQGAIGYSDR